ncbi:MAG: hypothetical protein ING44_19175 [Telmatospirillum sp.]|nr:hypothetical protein [Telmatospirillum sp.]
MATGEMIYLGFVLVLFATFAGVVLWVSADDVRNRANRRTNQNAANDSMAQPQQRAA